MEISCVLANIIKGRVEGKSVYAVVCALNETQKIGEQWCSLYCNLNQTAKWLKYLAAVKTFYLLTDLYKR